jgi:RNA polymerase sigma-70 factor (ECF subfamily)
MAVAKNRLRETGRHRAVANDPAFTVLFEDESIVEETGAVPDNRLNLMFVCAHPAIDEKLRTPLMLQVVLGLDAARIAAAFLVSPGTMAQRLVRAKQKIRDAGIPFDAPEQRELGERLHAVLEGIYAAFGTAWNELEDDANRVQALDGEALFLAQLVVRLMPDEPEAMGLLALMMFSHARRAARYAHDGTFVPLAQQDLARWDRAAIIEAEQWLMAAASQRRPGPYQLEAAIQSAHCQRLFTGSTPWSGIAQLYAYLNQIAPTVASRVAHSVACAESGALLQGQAILDELESAGVQAYQPYWVARWHLHKQAGAAEQAVAALRRAIGLTRIGPIRGFLQSKLDQP